MSERSSLAGADNVAFQTPRVVWVKFNRPAPNGLVGNNDPAFRHHFLHQAQTERKAEMQPYRMGDDLGGKAMADIATAVADDAAARMSAATIDSGYGDAARQLLD